MRKHAIGTDVTREYQYGVASWGTRTGKVVGHGVSDFYVQWEHNGRTDAFRYSDSTIKAA